MTRQVTLAIVGAGGRGRGYAGWVAEHPDRASVVAVADPTRAGWVAAEHGIEPDHVFRGWEELASVPRLADAVLICTQDEMHVEPALAFLALGYDVLLEKPMAPTVEECRVVAAAAQASGQIFAVCHVLRYTPYTKALKGMLDAGAIGEVMSIQHLERVGWFHQAHSFVRGNWRKESESSSMLLAKSCHDLDWLKYIVGRPIVAQASFGSLGHFRADQAPEGAALRCLECPLERTCAYSATRIYLDRALAGEFGWPVDVLASEVSVASVREALRDGPYGRCVYHCDNDVVDHQVVAMEFEGGATGTFTMTAFTELDHRMTHIFGSQGRIAGDGTTFSVLDFRTGVETGYDPLVMGGADAGSGHGGGDAGLMDAFVAAVAHQDQSLVSSDAASTLSSHGAVFAAERSRHARQVVETPPL